MYTKTIINAVAANANLTTSAHEVQFRVMDNANLSCEVVMTGNGTTGVVKLQASDNGTTFYDVEDATVTLTAAGTFSFSMSNVLHKYYRLDYAKGDATTGTVTATLTFS